MSVPGSDRGHDGEHPALRVLDNTGQTLHACGMRKGEFCGA